MTRKEAKPGGAIASSPGISPPGLNCERDAHDPSYSLTTQPGGTSTRYPCRTDAKTRADGDEGALEGDFEVDEVVADGPAVEEGAGSSVEGAGARVPPQAVRPTAIATTPRPRSRLLTSSP